MRVGTILLAGFVALAVTWAAPIVQSDTCFPDSCSDPHSDTFFSFGTCCDTECCTRLRYWVYPASIAGVGFVAGAFFALCFQCR